MNITREQIDELEKWLKDYLPRIDLEETALALIAEWRVRQSPVIDQRVCKRCGNAKGTHRAGDLACPVEGWNAATFEPVEP